MKNQKLCSVVKCKNHIESKIGTPPIMFDFPPRNDPSFGVMKLKEMTCC